MKKGTRAKLGTAGVMLLLALMSAGMGTEKVRMDAALANPVVASGKTKTTFLKVALTGFELSDGRERPPVNVALVIDRSGSMSGEKINKAREAAAMAVSRLDARDIVSVVTYDSTVQVVVPATKLTDREMVLSQIYGITTGGSTALFAGVSKGAAEVRKFLSEERVNRVILISDGLANVGPQSPRDLGDLGRSLGRERISVTTIGLGTGYNEDLMVNLAQASDGNHAFAESATDLVAIFNREFSDVLSVVAQDVNVHIRCADGVRPVRVVGREAEIRGREISLSMNQLYSQQQKYAVLEVELPAGDPGSVFAVADVDVAYANAVSQRRDHLQDTVRVRVTASEAEAEKYVDRDAMASAVTQIANDANIAAMRLRDQGKVKEAEQALVDNASYIRENNVLIQSDELKKIEDANLEDSKSVGRSSWSIFGRKKMREKQYQTKNQQFSKPRKE